MAIMKDLQTLVAASPSVIYTTTQSQDEVCLPVRERELDADHADICRGRCATIRPSGPKHVHP